MVRYLAAFGVPEDHFAVDLTIARGLDYYTGTVYETVMLDHPEIGSICSGGRHDNWPSTTPTRSSPVGDLHRPDPAVLRPGGAEIPQRPAGHRPCRCPHPPHDRGPLPRHRLCHPAAAGGVRAQVYSEQKKFKGKMSYADKLHIPMWPSWGRRRFSRPGEDQGHGHRGPAGPLPCPGGGDHRRRHGPPGPGQAHPGKGLRP